jgi:biopolymer transport protein ExbD
VSGSVTTPRSGLYFIDVLACLLFSLTLALVGARFASEHTVAIELPEAAPADDSGSALDALVVTIQPGAGGPALWVENEALDFAALEARLQSAPPAALLIRSEANAISRVIAIAHGAGVPDIQLAYETRSAEALE